MKKNELIEHEINKMVSDRKEYTKMVEEYKQTIPSQIKDSNIGDSLDSDYYQKFCIASDVERNTYPIYDITDELIEINKQEENKKEIDKKGNKRSFFQTLLDYIV